MTADKQHRTQYPTASLILSLVLILASADRDARAADFLWTWTKGASTCGQPGNYSTTDTVARTPGGRYHASTWPATSGCLRLFGGVGYDSAGNLGVLNDAWSYDTATSTWNWVGGSSMGNQAGDYGTQGVEADSNVPGARESGVTWTDTTGTMWLFGGYGHGNSFIQGDLNDLWKYNPVTGRWTWMKGSVALNENGTYGSQGVEGSPHTPGSRYGAVSWTDKSGRLWLFGGTGYGAVGSSGNLNDLWRYDPATGNWAWMKGSSAINQAGVCGTRGVADAANTPGARYYPSAWTDSSGYLWLFGGQGWDSAGDQGLLNDLWRFDPSTGNWTWITGSSTRNQFGNYGVAGVPADTNVPGARYNAASGIDSSQALWLFGGAGADSVGDSNYLNDVWRYDILTGQWTWLKGSSLVYETGTYGTQGVPDPANTPGGRFCVAAWSETSGTLWLLGGDGLDSASNTGYLNDLWRGTLTRPAVTVHDSESFSSDVTNPTPGGTTGWTPFTASQSGQATDYDITNGALRVTITSGAGNRINGWISANSEWLPYASVGADSYVRGKFHMFRAGQSDMGNLNQVPNMRLRLATRFAQTSMLEVFNHVAGDPTGTNAGKELVPSSSTTSPSVYRVDLDPVDVAALGVAGEGISRGFEAYCLEPQENGALELAESSIGTYPAAELSSSSLWLRAGRTYQCSSSDAGDLKVFNSLTDGPFYRKFMLVAPGVLGAEVALDGTTDPTCTESGAGVTFSSTAVASNRVGLAVREFTEMGPNTARIRVEPGRQYRIRWHVTSSTNANTNPQLRMRARALKFMWSQKLEIGGALAAGNSNNAIAQQALPGVGTQNPEQQTPGENGGWYTLLMHTPMSSDIKAGQAFIAAQPGPGSASSSMRDIKLGADLIDTLSGNAQSVKESGQVTIDRVELLTYDLVTD